VALLPARVALLGWRWSSGRRGWPSWAGGGPAWRWSCCLAVVLPAVAAGSLQLATPPRPAVALTDRLGCSFVDLDGSKRQLRVIRNTCTSSRGGTRFREKRCCSSQQAEYWRPSQRCLGSPFGCLSAQRRDAAAELVEWQWAAAGPCRGGGGGRRQTGLDSEAAQQRREQREQPRAHGRELGNGPAIQLGRTRGDPSVSAQTVHWQRAEGTRRQPDGTGDGNEAAAV
jgi:hypothetical protein